MSHTLELQKCRETFYPFFTALNLLFSFAPSSVSAWDLFILNLTTPQGNELHHSPILQYHLSIFWCLC